jgi:hypothetical protein
MRVRLCDYVAYGAVAIEVHGYLLKVFEAAAEQEPARRSAPQRDRGRRKGLMPAAGFAHDVRCDRCQASELIIRGHRVHKIIFTFTHSLYRSPFY